MLTMWIGKYATREEKELEEGVVPFVPIPQPLIGMTNADNYFWCWIQSMLFVVAVVLLSIKGLTVVAVVVVFSVR